MRVVIMPRKTQNAIKLFMELQTMRSIFDPGILPESLDTGLNDLMAKADLTITIRKDMNV